MNQPPKSITAVTLVLGAVIQLFGYVTSIARAAGDPLNAILLSALGLVVMTPIAWHYIFAKSEATESVLVLVDGEAPHKPRQPLYRKRTRIIVAALWVVFSFLTSILVASKVIALSKPINDAKSGDYPIRYAYNTLVEGAFNINWGGKFAAYASVSQAAKFFETDGKEQVFFAIPDAYQGRAWTKWSLGVAVLTVQFDLAAKADHSPVKVDRVQVCVDAYRPPPKLTNAEGETEIGGSPVKFFYVRIAPPPDGRRKCFQADYLPERGNEAPGLVYIKPGEPERILVKIDSSVEGYYMVSAEVLLSSGNDLQRVVLGNWRHVIYSK